MATLYAMSAKMCLMLHVEFAATLDIKYYKGKLLLPMKCVISYQDLVSAYVYLPVNGVEIHQHAK